jgi:Fe-S-cluster containining protein
MSMARFRDAWTDEEDVAPSVRCLGCGACCKGLVVEVLVGDDVPRDLYEHEHESSLLSAGVVQERAPFSDTVMRHRPDGSCIALGPDMRCTIYDHRPAVCRQFKPGTAGICPSSK